MKRIKLFSAINLILFGMLMIWSSSTYAQKGDLSTSSFSGGKMPSARVSNGMLVFPSKAAYYQAEAQLDELISQNNKSKERKPFPIPDDNECEDDGVLMAFEAQFEGYTSLRSVYLKNECAGLYEGKRAMPEPWLAIDGVASSLLNSNYEVQVGNEIVYAPYPNIAFCIEGASVRTLRQLQKGVDPYSLKGVKITGDPADGGCTANFGINGNTGTNKSLSFSFLGTPTAASNPGATITYLWTFGDGQTSTDKDPSHTYTAAGTYEVCVKVEMNQGDTLHCMDRFCRNITIAEDTPQDTTPTCYGAAAFAWNETGEPGELCFTHVGNIVYNSQIASYSWTFGTGGTSTAQHPCFTYDCNLDPVWASLTVTLQNGCQSTIAIPINVSSTQCCEKRPKVTRTVVYATKKKIEIRQKVINWFLGRKIKARVIHKKQKNNGNWKKEKKHLRVETLKDVYTESAAGCGCENAYDVTDEDEGWNVKKIELKKKISAKFWTKKGWEWEAKYYVDGGLKLHQPTTVACD